jgi:hypothetical protein
MQPDSTSSQVSAMVQRQLSKKKSEYYLVAYDTNGTILRETLLSTLSDERTLTQVRSVPAGRDEIMLLGSYGLGTGSSNQRNMSVEDATGLFASPVVNGSQTAFRFYNFLELQHAGAIAGKEEMTALQKKAQKKQKSLAEYSLDFPVLMHDVIRMENQYIVTAELFSPQYRTENFTDFDFYGRPYTNSYSVFEGYRFYNAVVAGFNMQGKLLWDNNIEIRNLVSFELSPKVVTYVTGTDLVLCYTSDGRIGSKIVRENSVIEKLDFTPIDLLYPEDKLIAETKGSLVYWSRNYFLTCGYQEIKNIALESNNKRLVFFFSKVQFEN